jgi:hypothetical protein
MLRLSLFLVLLTGLAACETRLNPLNWFGGAEEERVVVDQEAVRDPNDPRDLVATVASLNVDALPGNSGAILRAVGVPPTQGFWEAELVEVPGEEGQLVYEFRVFPPAGRADAGPQPSREIVAGAELNRFDLQGIRTITVRGAANQLTVRR